MTFTATTARPYPHLERATSGLRAELRHQMLAAGIAAAPDWSSLVVDGPQQFTDGRGVTWFGYWAPVEG